MTGRMGCAVLVCGLWLAGAARGALKPEVLVPGPEAGAQLMTRLLEAAPGDVIELGEGVFPLDRGVDVACDHLTLKGAGPGRTVLSFKGQQSGSDGILATANALTIQDLTVEDAPGNGIKVVGADGVTFRRVEVRWSGGPKTENGPYGLYPVQCRNVLIEECTARGASDAGIYVGQSKGVIVRRSRAEGNVAGIEIENTTQADVHDNVATGNSGGILIFDLPNLDVKKGGQVRVFRNEVTGNNLANFASPGTMVAGVPAGTGVMVIATDRVEVFDNEIGDNQTANAVVVSFLATERTYQDQAYDPLPEGISIHHNRFAPGGDKPAGKLGMALGAVLGRPFPDVLYDGIGGLPPARALRLADNGAATFANVKLGEFSPAAVLTGRWSADRDPRAHAGRFPALPPVKLAAPPRLRRGTRAATAEYRSAPQRLSAWGLFDATSFAPGPRPGVPYDLNTALFSDHSVKHRAVRTPPGKPARYRADGVLEFPVGTVIAKTFAFERDARNPAAGEQVVETRIEVRRPSGWYGYAYLWNAAGTEATLALGGAAVPIERTGADGQPVKHLYQVPSAAQCLGCHAQAGRFEPLGPTAANLNRELAYPGGAANQLAHWKAAKILGGLPAKLPAPLARFDDPGSGTVDERARAWLAVNCAHCHNPAGAARTTGLDLRTGQREPAKYGVFKTPVAAGRGSAGHAYDIVPRHPESSILYHRLASNEPGVRMPSLGRQLAYPPAIRLIEEWIRGMPAGRSGDTRSGATRH